MTGGQLERRFELACRRLGLNREDRRLDTSQFRVPAVAGDQLGGSMHPAQNFFLRPFAGWSRYETPIDGLYLCGAATWPGAGVGAGSGYLLGKRLTRRRRLLRA